ncbi:MAG: BadF/BadG/BcrA/BcrD ATPase family protein [Turicibacter sp.]
MRCVVGIDGGGTKTHLVCTDLNENVLCEVFGGASNLCANPLNKVKQNLTELLEKCKGAIDSEFEIVSVCLGTAGLIAKNAKEDLTQILAECTNCQTITIVGDMETAMVANLDDEAGMILISGTGAIGYGMTTRENTYRSGGWGHLVGDEGSAYWIGCEGVKAALKSYDGRAPKTMLYEMFLNKLNCETHQQFISLIYSQEFNKTEMAKLAVVVAQANDLGDAVAEYILRLAATELASLASSIVNKLGLSKLPTFKIVLAGSVFLNNDLVKKSFKGKIEDKYTQAEIVELEVDSAYGAIKIALGG